MKNNSHSCSEHYFVREKTDQEELQMWQGARDYYISNGWDELAEAAEKQIIRLTEKIAKEFVLGKGQTSSMMRLVTEEKEDSGAN